MTQNQIFTLSIALQETSQRVLSQLIGSNVMVRKLKSDFYKYLRFGDSFRKEYLKAMKVNFTDQQIELHESDVDFLYELIKEGIQYKTADEQNKAIELLKSIN